MANKFIYMPVMRVRQEETKTLRSFDFGDRIYPCLEILKEKDRDNNKKVDFASYHLDLIKGIKAKNVFIDIPMHFKVQNNTKDPIKKFMRQMTNMDNRNARLLELSSAADKIIPVISTYFNITGRRGSFAKQESVLRKKFPRIAFRIFADKFEDELSAIEMLIQPNDFVIVDFVEDEINLTYADTQDIQDRLEYFDTCPVIIVRSAVPNKLTYPGLINDTDCGIDNSLLTKFKTLNADAFGDYVGVKRDAITDGGASFVPGFFYYVATSNQFFGFRGNRKDLDDYGTVIVPAVMASTSSRRMRREGFLQNDNIGWKTLNGIVAKTINHKRAATFKYISLEHYLYCMRKKIEDGDFD